MKIHYVAFIRLPTEKAHGLQIMKTCEALANAGAEVELIIPGRKTPIAEDVFSYYRARENFSIVHLQSLDWVRFGTLGFFMSLLFFSEKTVWRRKFWTADVVYSRDALVLFQYLLLRRKYVFEAHARPSFIGTIVARHAFRVVVISEGLKTAFLQAKVLAEKIVVAPDAVDPQLFADNISKKETRRQLGFSESEKIVLYAGHLYERKGVDILPKVAEALPEVSFVFIGGTDGDVTRFKTRWGHFSNVHILGHQPFSKVPLYLRAADVLVIPNSARNDDAAVFTSPMKLFEYMASGSPIVASDVPSIREVLPENAALFFTPDDSASLQKAIEETLHNKDAAKTRAHNAKELISQYSWERRARVILDALK